MIYDDEVVLLFLCFSFPYDLHEFLNADDGKFLSTHLHMALSEDSHFQIFNYAAFKDFSAMPFLMVTDREGGRNKIWWGTTKREKKERKRRRKRKRTRKNDDDKDDDDGDDGDDDDLQHYDSANEPFIQLSRSTSGSCLIRESVLRCALFPEVTQRSKAWPETRMYRVYPSGGQWDPSS